MPNEQSKETYQRFETAKVPGDIIDPKTEEKDLFPFLGTVEGIPTFSVVPIDKQEKPDHVIHIERPSTHHGRDFEVSEVQALWGDEYGSIFGSPIITAANDQMAGVQKSKEFYPFPKTLGEVKTEKGREISQFDREDIWYSVGRDLYNKLHRSASRDEKVPEFEKRISEKMQSNISAEEKAQIQEDVKKAREDVDLLADRIIKKVWPKKEKTQSQ